MNNLGIDYIDLTISVQSNGQRVRSNDIVVILDTDDSSYNAPGISVHRERAKPKKNQAKLSITIEKENEKPISNTRKKCNKFGTCIICLEELDCNPLASTLCGHVYCLQCLEQWLHKDRKCPTCRRTLEDAKSYHPIYIFE